MFCSCFFFFKQKTAYEMRISDWSSDVCSSDLMALLPADCSRHYVGKTSGYHSLPQPEINQLLADLALQNKRVVRLKGGDPFIFGRGAEERSAERRVGKEWVHPCRSRWLPSHYKKQNVNTV